MQARNNLARNPNIELNLRAQIKNWFNPKTSIAQNSLQTSFKTQVYILQIFNILFFHVCKDLFRLYSSLASSI